MWKCTLLSTSISRTTPVPLRPQIKSSTRPLPCKPSASYAWVQLTTEGPIAKEEQEVRKMKTNSNEHVVHHSALTSAEQRLKKLGAKLPAPPEPFGAYVEAVQTGNLLFLSGMLPTEGQEPLPFGVRRRKSSARRSGRVGNHFRGWLKIQRRQSWQLQKSQSHQ